MTNYAKFGSDEPLEGGSTAIFACNHAKSLSSMFFDQMPTFLTPGKVIGNKKVFSLHPTAHAQDRGSKQMSKVGLKTYFEKNNYKW